MKYTNKYEHIFFIRKPSSTNTDVTSTLCKRPLTVDTPPPPHSNQ